MALEQAIEAVRERRMSLRQAAKDYEVPRATLCDRLKEDAQEKLGRPTELTMEEEAVLVERLIIMGNWGFPLSTNDLRHVIQTYLNEQGRATRFINNRPGKDFVKGFMKRHPQLTVRTANLIKRQGWAFNSFISITLDGRISR